MIKIFGSFIGQDILIAIDGEDISIDSNTDILDNIINDIYLEIREDYSPALGSIGHLVAMELIEYGVKILKIEEPESDGNAVF